MSVVRAPAPGPPRWLPEALLLRTTPDGILVCVAPVGRACCYSRLPDRRSHQERRSHSVHASPRRHLTHPDSPGLRSPPCSASGDPRRGRRAARRIFLVALLVSLHPPNHRQPPTAFGTDNGRSALATGTALHAPHVWTGCTSQMRWCCRKSLICIRPGDRLAGRGLDGSTHAVSAAVILTQVAD